MKLTEQKEPTRGGDSAAHEFRLTRGNFVGVVQSCENRYTFLVRDQRRERPTIHGCGLDFPQAVATVAQLMDSLTHSA